MLKILRFAAALALGVVLTLEAYAQSCYESFISTPSPFMGNNDEVFRLSDGSIWQVKHEYQYLYAYTPAVVICPGKGKLIINGKQLQVELLSEQPRRTPKVARPTKVPSRTRADRPEQNTALKEREVDVERNESTSSGNLIETRIDGDFSGWDGETIFKLANGQIWQQNQYAYTYRYAYSPKVMIFKTDSGYKMQVEGMDKSIGVMRLR